MDVADPPESPTMRLRSLLHHKFKRLEERLFARRVCTESLAAYHAVRGSAPTLRGDELYAAVIARRIQLDANAARAILWRAHASVDDWISERGTTFRDVVKYMIVSEYLGQEADESGMNIDLGQYLSKRIDAHY